MSYQVPNDELLKSSVMLASAEPFISKQLEEFRNGLYVPPDLRKRDSAPCVISLSSAPVSTLLKRGPEGRNPPCICPNGTKHISYFEAMAQTYADREIVVDFCADRNTFLTGRLPCWATGLRNKTPFTELPTVYNLFHLFETAVYWWPDFSNNHGDKRKFNISREARLLLIASTGLALKDVKHIPTKDLLRYPCDRSSLGRIRNWFVTLDGLLVSLLLGSQGHPEICSWKFFEKVMQTYLKSAISDLFAQRAEDETYYGLLKKNRNLIKDKVLKERRSLIGDRNGNYFNSLFWYFDFLVKKLNLNVEILTPEGVKTIAYITQTRASGLPPEPIKLQAREKFLKTVTQIPEPIKEEVAYELSRAVDSLCSTIKSTKNWDGLMNRSCLNTKISLSNSASFFYTREKGGKVEAARVILENLPDNCPYFDLDTGKVLFKFGRDDNSLRPGEKLLHRSLAVALTDLNRHDGDKPHVGDVRITTVEEPGKARLISVSRVEHSILLHPLAHFLSTLIATIPSSKTGMTASNHLWDMFVRINSENIPDDELYDGVTTFIGSEDWESATDAINPYPIRILMDGLRENFQIPKFYANLCKTLLTMPRRIYEREILRSEDYHRPIAVKITGIFQGDPCCKQMLHTVHLVSRLVGNNRLKRLGRTITLPVGRKDGGGNFYSSFPNQIILMKRLSRQQILEEIRRLLTLLPQGDQNLAKRSVQENLLGLLRRVE